MIKTSKRSRRIIDIVLLLLSIIWVFPIVFMLLGVMKNKVDYNMSNFWELPKKFSLAENFGALQRSGQILSGFYNSLIYGLLGTVLAIIIALLAAYAISHLDIKLRMFWFLIIYSGTVFPFQIYLIPILKGYNKLGLYNTKLGMILFYTAICIPFSMFVFRNYFIGIPSELGESAKIDGASNFKILTSMFLPMAKTPISIVFLTQFSWIWNDMLFGITFTKSHHARPIMSAITQMGEDNTPVLLMACLVASLPTLVLFILLNKNLDQGVAYQSK